MNWLKNQYSSSTKNFAFKFGYDDFGRPDQEVSDLYILFVLSLFDAYRVDYSNKVKSTIEMFEDRAYAKDSYKLAIAGLLNLSLNRTHNLKDISQKLVRNQDKKTGEFANSITSITSSSGSSLSLETTALGVLFLLSLDDTAYLSNVEKAVEYILSKMESGFFSSTQATILCMKALVEYSAFKNTVKSGVKTFEIQIQNKTKKYSLDFDNDSKVKEYPIIDWNLQSIDTTKSIAPRFTPLFEMSEGEKFLFSLDYK